MQTFNTNIYDASRSQRSFGGNVVGRVARLLVERHVRSQRELLRPNRLRRQREHPANWRSRAASARSSRRRPSISRSAANSFISSGSATCGRRELRFRSDTCRLLAPDPLSVQEVAVVYRELVARLANTFYTRSQDPDVTDSATGQPLIVNDSLNRQYFTLQAQIVGPAFVRVFDAPGNKYAERFKHTIEPFLNITRTSSVANYTHILQSDGVDSEIGSTTRYNYGLNNRFYAKRPVGRLERLRRGKSSPCRSRRRITPTRAPRSSILATARALPGRSRATSRRSSFPSGATPLDTTSGTLSAEFDSTGTRCGRCRRTAPTT